MTSNKEAFDFEIYFSEVFHRKAGFDVVIANPPYVRQEKSKELKPALKVAGYECFNGTADLYVYFFERGVNLLRRNGALAYISSNSFLNSAFGQNLRRFLTSNTRIRQLIDFAETRVFDAITEPCVLCLTRDNANGHEARFLKWDQSTPPERIREAFEARSQTIHQSELKPEGWQLERPAVLRLLEKMRRAGKPLGDYVNCRFYYGIKTGLNEAFVVDRATRDRLIREHKSSAEVLKPYLRGRDIRRWHTVDPELWLIFTRHGIDIQKYPAILEHLKPFKKSLMPGVPGGRKPGSYKWYEIQDNIAYWLEFEQPKLIYQEINRTTAFAWDEKGFFCNNKLFIMPGASRFLLALLNSRAGRYLIHRSSGVPEGGFLALQSPLMKPFPIPAASSEEQKQVERLVARVLAAKQRDAKADVSELEREIDELVYALYSLTPEEIKLIEDSRPGAAS